MLAGTTTGVDASDLVTVARHADIVEPRNRVPRVGLDLDDSAEILRDDAPGEAACLVEGVSGVDQFGGLTERALFLLKILVE
jgi:hypothetical protein